MKASSSGRMKSRWLIPFSSAQQDRTLEDKDVTEVMGKILCQMEKLGVRIRQ